MRERISCIHTCIHACFPDAIELRREFTSYGAAWYIDTGEVRFGIGIARDVLESPGHVERCLQEIVRAGGLDQPPELPRGWFISADEPSVRDI